jgi:hypothetical protein
MRRACRRLLSDEGKSVETGGTVEELEMDNEDEEDDDVVEDELVVVRKAIDDAVLDEVEEVSLVWVEELDEDVLVELRTLEVEIEVNKGFMAAVDEVDAEERVGGDGLIDRVDIELADTRPEEVW